MTPTPQQLTDALVANGWTIAGQRTGMYTRLNWPGETDRYAGSLIVPADPAYADYTESLGSVLAQLARHADTGRRAAAVLASLGGQQDAPTLAIDCLTDDQKRTLWKGTWEAYKTQYWAFQDANPGWQAFFTDHHGSALDAALQYALEEFAKVKSSTDEEQNDTSSCPASDSGPTPRAQSSTPQPVTVFHAWSVEDAIPDVNELYADLEHAKASTVELFLDSEVGSEDEPKVHAERAKEGARLGWVQKHSTWELIYTDTPGMAGWTDVCIGERRIHAKPAPAGLDLSPAVERITAIAPGADLIGDTWLPADVLRKSAADMAAAVLPAAAKVAEEFTPRVNAAIAGWRHAGGIEPSTSAVLPPQQLCSDKVGPHGDHHWRPDPSGGLVECPGIPWVPKAAQPSH